jgi:site-specific recombinase XerD
MVLKLSFIHNRRKVEKTKESVVELRISAGKERKYISTGVKVLPKEWSNGSVVGRKDWKELNDQIQVIKKKVSEIVTKMMDEDCLDLGAIPGILKGRMVQQETFISYAKGLAKLRERSLSVGTIKHYKTIFDFLESWKGLTYFSDITERTILKMDDELASRGLKESSRWNYHKIVKIFVQQAFDDGLIKTNPYKRVGLKRGGEDGLHRCLTIEEFNSFKNCVIPLESLRKVRDLFVFQTYTCLSYSDLEVFDYKKCEKIKGQVVYKGRRVKTGQEFTIVLLKPALEILNRYKNKLPIISNVKYNLYLKAAVRYAKIDKPVSTHWARHTGATILLNEGNVPMHIVQHILGHATIRETEKTYAKVLDRSIVESMEAYSKKLG